MYIYFLMLHIQLPVLPVLYLWWAEINMWWHHHRFGQHPRIGILEKALFWDSNHEFLYVIVVFTVFPRLSQVWGEICSHPPRDLHPLPYLHSGDREFQETLCGNSNNAIGIIELSLCWEPFLRMSCSSKMGTCMHRGNLWSPNKK